MDALSRSSTLIPMSSRERLDFETLLLYLRLSFLLAPLLLLASYGMSATRPAIEVAFAILADCAVAWGLLRWFPSLALQRQLSLRGLDIIVAYTALHFAHLFLRDAYYDSVYLLLVVAATATHGRRGTYLVSAISALAVFAGRFELILQGYFPFQVRHVTDSIFYGLLFLTTGLTTEFLMKKSAETVARHEREAAEAVRESEERYRGLFENATDIVYEHDLEGRIATFNRAAERRLGYSRAESIGFTVADVVHPDDLERVRQMTAAKLAGDASTTYELRLLARDGGILHVEVSSQLIVKGGIPVAVQGIARDITERKLREAQLRHEALHDPLTGLPNRVLFLDRVQAALAAARRSGDGVAVLLLDLDRFKPVNDTFGHGSGDELLRELAAGLTAALRDSDTVARLGGDEFAVLLSETDEAGAVQVAQKLAQVISTPHYIEGHAVSVGSSIGIALFPDHSDTVDVILQQADAAMYDAKRTGCGYHVFSAPDAPCGKVPRPAAL